MPAFYKKSSLLLFITVLFLALGFQAYAQSGGSSTSVTGTVVDPTGAVVANAVVEIRNPVSGFERTVTTDGAGKFTIPNIPFNPRRSWSSPAWRRVSSRRKSAVRARFPPRR